MNIALLLPTLNGGGAERVASELSKYFTQEGHHVFVFTGERTKNDYTFKGKIVKIPGRSNDFYYNIKWLNMICRIVSTAKRVKRLKKDYNIDVTISFMEEINWINFLSKGRDKVVTRICTILSARKRELRGILYSNFMVHLLYNRADRVVVLTECGKRDMVNVYGVSAEKITVISNPLSSFASSEEPEEDWPYGEKTIICPLRIDEVKQQKLLVQCFQRVKKIIPEAKLLLVGKDVSDYAGEVKKLVKQLHLEQDVVITGYKKNVQYYIKNSTGFILTSKGEGFSSAIIEALSIGTPVISTDCPGGPREILAPSMSKNHKIKSIEKVEYGILVPYIHEDAAPDRRVKKMISDAMILLLSDSNLRQEYAQKGKERSECYSIEIIGKRWDNLITGLF